MFLKYNLKVKVLREEINKEYIKRNKVMEEYNKFFNNANILLISKCIMKLIVFLMIPIYTRYFSTDEYGNIDIITTTVNLIIPLFTLGISEAVLRFTLDNRKATLKIGIKIILLSDIIVIGLALIIYKYIINYKYMGLIVLYYISVVLYDLICMYIQGLNKLKELIKINLIGLLINLIITVFFIFTNKLNIVNYFISLIVSNLIVCILFLTKVKNKEKGDKKLAKEMIKYSSPFILNSTVWWINNSADKYIITYIYGTEKNGIYSAASKIASIFTFVSNTIVQAMQISIIESYKKDRMKETFNAFYNSYCIIGAVITSLIILIAKVITNIMFGTSFLECWKYIGILTLSAFFGGLLGITGTVFAAVKKTKQYVLTTLVGTLINIGLNTVFIPKFAIMGATITTAISYFIVLLIRNIQVRKIVDIKKNIIKRCLIYLCLTIQIIISIFMQNVIGYTLQIIILTIIIFIYRKEILNLIRLGFKLIKR